ncbi:MAG: hypothetical protein KGL04_10245 [Elusimicrobia bacterium]|nr:hypothetical protein [Elusimicrobiota bacterium]
MPSGLKGLDAVSPHQADLTAAGSSGGSYGILSLGGGGGGGSPGSGTVSIAGSQGSSYHPRPEHESSRVLGRNAQRRFGGVKRFIFSAQSRASESRASGMFGAGGGMFADKGLGDAPEPALSVSKLISTSAFASAAEPGLKRRRAGRAQESLGELAREEGLAGLDGGLFGGGLSFKNFGHFMFGGNSVANQAVQVSKSTVVGAATGFAAGGVPGAIAGGAYGMGKGIYGQVEGAPVGRTLYQTMIPALALGAGAGALSYGEGWGAGAGGSQGFSQSGLFSFLTPNGAQVPSGSAILMSSKLNLPVMDQVAEAANSEVGMTPAELTTEASMGAGALPGISTPLASSAELAAINGTAPGVSSGWQALAGKLGSGTLDLAKTSAEMVGTDYLLSRMGQGAPQIIPTGSGSGSLIAVPGQSAGAQGVPVPMDGGGGGTAEVPVPVPTAASKAPLLIGGGLLGVALLISRHRHTLRRPRHV